MARSTRLTALTAPPRMLAIALGLLPLISYFWWRDGGASTRGVAIVAYGLLPWAAAYAAARRSAAFLPLLLALMTAVGVHVLMTPAPIGGGGGGGGVGPGVRLALLGGAVVTTILMAVSDFILPRLGVRPGPVGGAASGYRNARMHLVAGGETLRIMMEEYALAGMVLAGNPARLAAFLDAHAGEPLLVRYGSEIVRSPIEIAVRVAWLDEAGEFLRVGVQPLGAGDMTPLLEAFAPRKRSLAERFADAWIAPRIVRVLTVTWVLAGAAAAVVPALK